MDAPTPIELYGDNEPPGGDDTRAAAPRTLTVAAGVAVIVAAVAVVGALISDDGGRGGQPSSIDPTAGPAADCYAAEPNAADLRIVFGSIGGFDGLVVGEASGAFDLVTFDPLDHSRLLAAHRAGYGRAENQEVNEEWRVAGGEVVQDVWDASTPHDFVHHNADGTTTMWAHSGDEVGFAPRNAVVLDRDGAVVTATSAAMYADRFAVDGGTVFALTGDPRYFAPRDPEYLELLADDGVAQTRLASGAGFAWLDVPAPGILVAYPANADGVTAVWDTATLAPLANHPLAGRAHRRVAVAADGRTALGVRFDGRLEAVELATGRASPPFGALDVTEIDSPIALSPDGSVALTVDRSGTVSVWFVGDDVPIATYRASTGLPRWLPTSRSAARLTSVLAPDASRLALRIDARPGVGLTWVLVDTELDSWLDRARTARLSPESSTRISC
ncbi:MAG: hypothetical protein ACR2O6_04370 [Ilumatobacteraceae bacterium]